MRVSRPLPAGSLAARLGTVAALATLAVLTTVPTMPPATASVITEAAAPTGDDGPTVSTVWDGPAIHLDYRGQEVASVETDSFISTRVISPGDQITRTLNLTSDAPETGVLHILVIASEQVPDGAQNPGLAQDVELTWQAADQEGATTFAALLTEPTGVELAAVPILPGQTIPVTLSVRFDEQVTDHRNGGADSVALDFKVRATITGNTEPTPTPTPTPSETTGTPQPTNTEPAPSTSAPSPTTSSGPTASVTPTPSTEPTVTQTNSGTTDPTATDPDAGEKATDGFLAKTGTTLLFALLAGGLLVASAVVRFSTRNREPLPVEEGKPNGDED